MKVMLHISKYIPSYLLMDGGSCIYLESNKRQNWYHPHSNRKCFFYVDFLGAKNGSRQLGRPNTQSGTTGSRITFSQAAFF